MIMRGLLDDPALWIRRYRSAIEGLPTSFETRSSPVQLHEWSRERYSHQNVLSALKLEPSAAILLIVDRECSIGEHGCFVDDREVDLSAGNVGPYIRDPTYARLNEGETKRLESFGVYGVDIMPVRKPVTETKMISEARSQLGGLVDRVKRRQARVVVEKNGAPVAAIVSMKDLAQLNQLEEERERDFARLDAISEKFLDVPVEELERQVALALAEAREKHRAQFEKPTVRTA
jgi:prevent-host-death family protein